MRSSSTMMGTQITAIMAAPPSSLFLAAAAGNLVEVASRVSCGATTHIDRPDPATGSTLLTAAARGGHRAVVAYLVDAGASVDRVDRESGCTALACAAFRDHRDVVDLLISRGADVRGMARTVPWTPLWCAAAGGHADIVAVLLKHGAAASSEDGQWKPLDVACCMGHADIVALLLAAFDTANTFDAANTFAAWSEALHTAATNDHVDVVRALYAVVPARPPPADVHVRSAGPRVAVWFVRTRGFTAFDLACDRGDVDAVRGFLRGNVIAKSAVVAAAARTGTYRHGAAVDAVLRTALASWSPRVHAVWPASFRTMVVPVLCACRARNLPRAVALAHVLPCCGRDWWRRHGPALGGEGEGDGDGGGDDPPTTPDNPSAAPGDPRAERRDAGQQPAPRLGAAVVDVNTAVDVAAAAMAAAFAAVILLVDMADMADAVVAAAVVFAAVFVVVAPAAGHR